MLNGCVFLVIPGKQPLLLILGIDSIVKQPSHLGIDTPAFTDFDCATDGSENMINMLPTLLELRNEVETCYLASYLGDSKVTTRISRISSCDGSHSST